MQVTKRIGGSLLATAAVALVLVAGARGQDGEVPPVEFTTEIMGTAPAGLDGRWLSVAHLALPNGKTLNIPGFLEIDLGGAEPSVTRVYAKLPEAQQKALDAANAANAEWKPTAADVQAIAAAWDSLPADPQGVASMETAVFSPDGFDETITENEGMKDARWALRQRESYQPGGNRPMTQVVVLSGVEQRDEGWHGPYVSVTVAAAPFPVPITFKGAVDMYRLVAGAHKGFLARVLDVFSGCGR